MVTVVDMVTKGTSESHGDTHTCETAASVQWLSGCHATQRHLRPWGSASTHADAGTTSRLVALALLAAVAPLAAAPRVLSTAKTRSTLPAAAEMRLYGASWLLALSRWMASAPVPDPMSAGVLLALALAVMLVVVVVVLLAVPCSSIHGACSAGRAGPARCSGNPAPPCKLSDIASYACICMSSPSLTKQHASGVTASKC